jgi:FtsP/CotA-like multicopper oxidase with cupredoxin domain
MTSTIELLAALGAHLTEFELPPIASVHLSDYNSGPPVTVQLSGRAPSAIATGLLAWADTLTEITAQAWRVPQGDTVHLSVTGRLPGGTAVQVYSGLRVTDLSLGTRLEPGATATVTLATLRHLAIPGHATEEGTL